jgi:hypothetical protein
VKGSAYADGPGGTIPNTSSGVTAKTPAKNVAMMQDGQTVHAYVSQSSRGTWLFQPHDGGGA